ncbi:MAG: PIN domain-containing protein [Candidatus Aminicenantes bacterium]|nr:PIN domain-containing protein [Candidatus Aminicenantes bacterium]
MILVDTSILIDYFRGVENKAIKSFNTILDKNLPFGINRLIYLEVLQGSRTEKDYKTLKRYLDTQVFFDLKNGRESYTEAAQMYLKLRKKGVTVSTIDCLIARVALENDLFLLHNDKDFTRISSHFSLKIWEI